MNWLKFLIVLAAAGGLAAGEAGATSRGPFAKGVVVKPALGKGVVVKPALGKVIPVAGKHHFRHHHRHHFRHHGHARVRIFTPVFFGWHYWPPYYRQSTYVAVPAEPLVYIERGDAAAPPGNAVGFWYHCQDPEGYYPYVNTCPGGWRQEQPRRPAE